MKSQDIEAQRNFNKTLQSLITETAILNPQAEVAQRTHAYRISKKNSNNNYRTQSPNSNRDGNRSQRPFSRNRLRNVRNYINSLLDQEQTDNTISHTDNENTQNVSEETLLEQQSNDLLLELNQDNQDEYFNCQEECNALTEEYILSTFCKSNIWVQSLTIYTQQTPDHKKTVSPPRFEIDFFTRCWRITQCIK